MTILKDAAWLAIGAVPETSVGAAEVAAAVGLDAHLDVEIDHPLDGDQNFHFISLKKITA
jgi:hypothetical protein